jgi:hypothetical protein
MVFGGGSLAIVVICPCLRFRRLNKDRNSPPSPYPSTRGPSTNSARRCTALFYISYIVAILCQLMRTCRGFRLFCCVGVTLVTGGALLPTTRSRAIKTRHLEMSSCVEATPNFLTRPTYLRGRCPTLSVVHSYTATSTKASTLPVYSATGRHQTRHPP